MSSRSWKIAAAGALLCGAGGYALAQNAAHDMAGMRGATSGDMAAMHAQMRQQAGTTGQPTLPGEDAFGAIREVVRILDADPKTDWSKIDLEALRQHLIDMNEVTLKADTAPRRIDGGLEIAVTGAGRTLLAIQRMVPEWAKMANGLNGWTAKAASLLNGELLTVTATTPKEIEHIRGLGFIGLLARGSWHQAHHLMMAKGELGLSHGSP
jgi:hypothetical protein